MEVIVSFKVDHTKLKPGFYVSRLDKVGDKYVTTFDIRMTTPNKEPAMGIDAMHAIEHLGATYLRSQEYSDQIIYFGPMGCCTGFYLIMAGDRSPIVEIDKLQDMMRFIADYEGKVPGASPKECGNYLTLNLPMAKFYARRYLYEVLDKITQDRMIYPE